MPLAAWIMVGVSITSHAFTVVWWLVRRPVGRLDRLEGAVFGESGVHMKLNRYVTTEAFEKRMSTVDLNMRGISEEGQKREDRILAAIGNQTVVIGSEVREIKQDMRSQATRIDEILMSRRADR